MVTCRRCCGVSPAVSSVDREEAAGTGAVVVDGPSVSSGAGLSAVSLPGPLDMVSLQDNLATLIRSATVDLRGSITALKDEIGSYNAMLSKHGADIGALINNVGSIEARLDAVESKLSARDVAPQVGSTGDVSSSEISDQLYRACNVLLYEVPVSDGGDDVAMVRSLLKDIPNLDLAKISVRRFSKPTARSPIPPVVVRFSTSSEVVRVITHRSRLPQGIVAAANLTPSQRAFRGRLLEAANKHNAEHPDKPKAVKFVRGRLTLVNAGKRQQLFPGQPPGQSE